MPKPQKKAKGPRGPKDRQNFNEDALAQLTSKIDQNLDSKTQKRKNPPTTAGSSEQQKRQRNSEDTRPSKGQASDEQEALLAEIKALGGDEKDLELINGVDSDDEEAYAKESGGAIDKGLKDELLALSKELGFANIDLAAVSEADDKLDEEVAEEEEEDDDDEDEEEDSDDDDEDDEQPIRVRKPGDMVGNLVLRGVEPLLTLNTRSLNRRLTGMATDLPSCLSRPSTSSGHSLAQLML